MPPAGHRRPAAPLRRSLGADGIFCQWLPLYQLSGEQLTILARTFLDAGFEPSRLVRHQYGYDPESFGPASGIRDPRKPLTALFVGGAAVLFPGKGFKDIYESDDPLYHTFMNVTLQF